MARNMAFDKNRIPSPISTRENDWLTTLETRNVSVCPNKITG